MYKKLGRRLDLKVVPLQSSKIKCNSNNKIRLGQGLLLV